jgi:hypothetical protein
LRDAHPKEAAVAPSESPVSIQGHVGILMMGFTRGSVTVGPSTMVGVVTRRPWLGVSWLRPSARVGWWLSVEDATIPAGSTSVSYGLANGIVERCPSGIEIGTGRVAACSRTEVGRLKATASRDGESSSEGRPWLATGATASFRQELGSTGRGVVWSLELSGGALGAVTRDTFDVDAEKQVVPRVVWTSTLAVGMGMR